MSTDLSSISWFKCSIYDGGNNFPESEFHFSISQVSDVEKYLKEYFLSRMYQYRCEGCNWCCYGNPKYQKWCEKVFTKENEIDEYLELCKDITIYQTKPVIYRVCFEELKNKFGYDMSEKLIWEFDAESTDLYLQLEEMTQAIENHLS